MKIILLLAVFCFELFALDINQAVQLALKNNHQLKKEKYVYEESEANKNVTRASFLPLINLGYTYNNRDKVAPTQTKEDSTFAATISYNLFNGFSDVNFYKSSSLGVAYNKLTYDATKYDIVLDTQTDYVNFLVAKSELATKKDALVLFQKQYLDAKNQFEQGIIAKNDKLQVEVEMLQAQQDVQDARSALKVARLTLGNAISTNLDGLKVSGKLVFDESKVYNNFDYKSRDEIKALSMLMSSYKSYRRAVQGDFLPKVDISNTTAKSGTNKSLGNVPVGYPSTQNTTTLQISWNLFNGGRDMSNALAYEKKAQQTSEQLEDTKQNIILQYKSAKYKLKVAKLNLATATLALRQAKINYSIMNNKFKEGLIKSTDLIDANYLLTKAKDSYNKAYYDKYLTLVTLDRITQQGL